MSQFFVQLRLLVEGLHQLPLIWVCGPLFYLWSEFLPLLFCCTLSCSFSCQFCSLNLFCYIRSGNYEPMHNPSNELGFCLEVLKQLLLVLIIIVTNNNNGNQKRIFLFSVAVPCATKTDPPQRRRGSARRCSNTTGCTITIITTITLTSTAKISGNALQVKMVQ